MQIEVPSERLTAQWKLGAWHILRRSVKDAGGQVALQRLSLRNPRVGDVHDPPRPGPPGHASRGRRRAGPVAQPADVSEDRARGGGHHPWALPDRPLGHFSDGNGCLTHAEGVPGVGGHMDGVHAMGPGAIMFPHGRALPADRGRGLAQGQRRPAQGQRRVDPPPAPAAGSATFPAESDSGARGSSRRTWSRRTANACTCSIYETEAYDWLAVKGLAQVLARSTRPRAPG